MKTHQHLQRHSPLNKYCKAGWIGTAVYIGTKWCKDFFHIGLIRYWCYFFRELKLLKFLSIFELKLGKNCMILVSKNPSGVSGAGKGLEKMGLRSWNLAWKRGSWGWHVPVPPSNVSSPSPMIHHFNYNFLAYILDISICAVK